MKINAVICCLNSKYIHSSLAPWCLLAGVEEHCNETICAQVVEGTINEAMEEVLGRIISLQPAVVGFCCYIWNITAVFELVQLVKEKLPHCVIVLGGPEVSYHAGEVLQRAPLVSYVISGEGELPFAMLLSALAEGLAVESIPGLCYRKGGSIVISKPYTPCEMPQSPYSKGYLEALRGRIAYLESSRGCPYSCAFCLSGRCGGVRYYDLERTKEEILLLANSGAKTIKLVDRTFNANQKRAKALFSFFICHYGSQIPEGVCFHFEIAGDLLDEETLSLLKDAPIGSMQFEIGLQSFHEESLRAIRRKTNVEKLKENIKALISLGNAHIHIDLIAGLPYEDYKTFQQSFHEAYALSPHMLQLGFLKLLHGAPMREEAQSFPCTYQSEPPYTVINTPWLTEEELWLLHQTEHALDRLYNRGRFRRTLQYLLSCLDMTPFQLYCQFGCMLAKTKEEQSSLDALTALVYSYFSSQPGVDQTKLRDLMVCDRLATNASGKLPAILRIEDPKLKEAVKRFEQTHGRTKGVKRGYALLYSEGCFVYVEYREKNPVTGEYALQKEYGVLH